MNLRSLRVADSGVLRTATLGNVNWTGAQRFTAADVERRPEFRHYLDFRPERGDFGFVAERGGGGGSDAGCGDAGVVVQRGGLGSSLERSGSECGHGWLGVVWVVHLDGSDPGYGYVADGIPELSLFVHGPHRGSGVGRTLLERAIREAGARGLAGISLSVEDGNPAVGLYRSVGFERAEGTQPGTFVLSV